MMTKKDYELLATTLGRAARRASSADRTLAILATADDVASELARTNPRFSPEKFGDWVREVQSGLRNEWSGQLNISRTAHL